MGSSRKVHGTGFSLIEVMIVVLIFGILALLATYSVRKYASSVKVAEARNSLGQIAKDAATGYEKDSMAGTILVTKNSAAVSRKFCASASTSVPAGSASVAGQKYQSNPAEWNVDAAGNSGFACLKFAIDQPQYYMYSYSTQGSSNPNDSFTATARGDLDANGVQSLFQITGSINSAYVLNIAPALLEVRPEE